MGGGGGAPCEVPCAETARAPTERATGWPHFEGFVNLRRVLRTHGAAEGERGERTLNLKCVVSSQSQEWKLV